MSALASIEPAAIGYDPLRDKSYQRTTLGRDIADFLAWCDLGGMSPKTLLNYEADLARGALLFPTRSVETLTDGDALHIAKQFPPASRRVRVASWRSFYKWAVRSRRATSNPFDSLPVMKKPHQRIPEVFTDAEVEQLLALPLVDAVCMCVLFDTGARKAEARHLRISHLLPESGFVNIYDGKGGRDRQVPMTQRLSMLMADLLLVERVDPTDFVFYSVKANDRMRKLVRERAVGEGTFARWWRRCLDDAGVRYRVPHTARHTFATAWRRKGLAIDDISDLLGHADLNTTKAIYTHSTVYDIAERMKRIEALEVDA